MASSLLSVIIPTYNRADYLPAAVESALAQVGVEVEVIVVDDGSTDATAATVEQRAPVWGERFRYLWQANAERSVARNHGLRHARGEFVAFLDSDDVWQSHHAQVCSSLLREDQSAIAAYGEYGLMTADGRPIRHLVKRPASVGKQFQRDLCLKRLILHPTGVVLRRGALNGSEVFDPEIPGAEDWLLWVQLAARASFLRVGEPTVWMRVHSGGTFGEPGKFSRSLLRAAQKVIATRLPARLGIPARRIRTINRIHCAYAHYLSGQTAEARAYLRAALGHYPVALREPDFWRVAARLCAGDELSRRLRALRQRGRGQAIEINEARADA